MDIKYVYSQLEIGTNKIKYTDKPVFRKVSNDVTINWENILPDPPLNSSETTKKELKYLSDLTYSISYKDRQLVIEADKNANFLYDAVLNGLGLDFPKEDFEKANDIIYPIIMNLKYKYNRPRPYQLAEVYNIKINVIETDTIHTPSYPSGHSAYAALGAYLLAAKYPEHSGLFFDKVGDISRARMLQGVHYPSDTEASMVIVGAVWEDIRYKLFPDYKQF